MEINFDDFSALLADLIYYWIGMRPSVSLSVCLSVTFFIPGIYAYGVGFWAPIRFRVPSVKFGPLGTKYLAENGVPRTF